MNYYEITVIIEPTLSDEDLEAVLEKIRNFITKGEGDVLKEDRWGKRTLAYELNKKSQGYYVLFTFKAPPALIKTLEDFFKVYDPVFKYMAVKLEKKQVAKLIDELQKSEKAAAQSGQEEEEEASVQ